MITPDETNPICIECGLWKGCRHPFMDAHGPTRPDILIIGEAPGEEEDKKNEPFVGPSGQLLRDALGQVNAGEYTLTNIVRCRPPNNKVTKSAILHCTQFALQEIEQYNPNQVWLMGNVPLNAVLGETGITNWNGSIVTKNNRTFVPLFHPAYILRNMDALDEWVDAMIKAIDGSETDYPFERIIPKSLKQIWKMEDWLGGCTFISFDTETSILRAFENDSFIVSLSFAGMQGKTKRSYSLPIYHPEAWWTEEELKDVEACVKRILMQHDGALIGQNVKYDFMHVYNQWGLSLKAGGDVMLISHLLDSRPGIHGLKKLAAIHLGWYEYERDLTQYIMTHPEANPKRGGSFAFVPLDILLPYGAMDAEATYLLHDILYERLSEKQKVLYDQMILAASDALTRMQCNGMTIDRYITARYRIIYEMFQRDALADLNNDPKVKTLTKRHQKAIDDYVTGTKRRRNIFKFNPGSPLQLSELYFELHKIPVLARSDKTRNPSTSSKIYRPLENKYPILYKVRYYKLLAKMLSTYLVPADEGRWASGLDGKVRTNYNLHGTITGRTSSSDPVNLQNIPTQEKEPGTLLEYLPIKNIFTHSYQIKKYKRNKIIIEHNGVLISVDFSGMELRCFASLADCKKMLQIIRSGKDVHSMVALSSIHQCEVDEVTDKMIAKLDKSVRYVYKWTNWTLLFGGDAYTLHRLYNIPLDQAEQSVKRYYNTFPEVPAYMDICVAFAEEHGYIESPFGRREWLPYINEARNSSLQNKSRREAVNMPVQSGAGDTLLIALIIIDYELRKLGLETKTVNEVHDSIVLDAPKREIHQVAELAKHCMENVNTLHKELMPGLSFDWLKCPLKADVEIGTHYGAEMPYEKWLEMQ